MAYMGKRGLHQRHQRLKFGSGHHQRRSAVGDDMLDFGLLHPGADRRALKPREPRAPPHRVDPPAPAHPPPHPPTRRPPPPPPPPPSPHPPPPPPPPTHHTPPP